MDYLDIHGRKYPCLSSRFFTWAGKQHEIVCTEITGTDVMDAIHTVKNLSTNYRTRLTHIELVTIISNHVKKQKSERQSQSIGKTPTVSQGVLDL